MQVSPISNINFSSKRYISDDAKEAAMVLLYRMKKDTVYKKNPKTSSWCTELLSTVSMGKVKFTNAELFTPSVSSIEQSKKIPDCTLQIGKNFLNINSKTGEDLSYKASLFTTLGSLISKADKYLRDILDNFNNSDVVKRNTFVTGGYIKTI